MSLIQGSSLPHIVTYASQSCERSSKENSLFRSLFEEGIQSGDTHRDMPLANHEIVVIALYLVGGGTNRVDTEDVAVKASEIAPGRFAWRRYPEQINIDTVRKRLWDAKKASKGAYLLGSEKEGWLLTETGREFAIKNIGKIQGEQPKKRVSVLERTWIRTEKTRLQATDAFLKFSDSRAAEISKRDAEGFFRIDDYVTGEARERKILRILNAFAEDPQISHIARAMAAIVRSGGEAK